MPKVSIIIPVYNTAPWLEECLNSVIHQTIDEIEIICVNDASTDASLTILEKYAEKDTRIKIISIPENKGQSHARNIGINMATGEYIYFLDSDDFISLNAAELLYNRAKEGDLDILFFDANSIFESEGMKKKHVNYCSYRKTDCGDKAVKGETLFRRFLDHDEWVAEVPRQFYSSELIKGNGLRFYEGIIHEDVLFSFQCVMSANSVLYIPDRLFNRRFRTNSTINADKSARNFCGRFCTTYYINQYVHEKNLYSGSIRSYIARLNNEAISLFQKYRTDVYAEIEKLNNQELLEALRQFEALQDVYCAYAEMTDEMSDQLRQYDSVYIYGAGVIAKSVYSALIRKELPISGFIVTKAKNNPVIIEGHRVYDLATLQSFENRNSIVIIALKSGKEEIAETLDQLNIRHMDYKRIKGSECISRNS